MKKINYLGFVSLLSLLGIITYMEGGAWYYSLGWLAFLSLYQDGITGNHTFAIQISYMIGMLTFLITTLILEYREQKVSRETE